MLKKLSEIVQVIYCQLLIKQVFVVDKTDYGKYGRPRKDLFWMIKVLFLQPLFNLSDPELEDHLIDRLSFQQFLTDKVNHTINFTRLGDQKRSKREKFQQKLNQRTIKVFVKPSIAYY